MEECENEVKQSIEVCQKDADDDLCPASIEIVIWVNLAPEERPDGGVD